MTTISKWLVAVLCLASAAIGASVSTFAFPSGPTRADCGVVPKHSEADEKFFKGEVHRSGAKGY
jgi:hypothetical protein